MEAKAATMHCALGNASLRPQPAQLEREAGQDRIADDRLGVLQANGFRARPVHVDFFSQRVDEPAEPGAVIEVLLHLLL